MSLMVGLQNYGTKPISAMLQYGLRHKLGKRAVRCMSLNDVVLNPASGFEWLFDCAPSFCINGNNVKVMNEPSEFYNTLKTNISKARNRVTLASLYLGTGTLEQDLVSCIRDSLLNAKKANADFKVSVLLDHIRGSRGKSCSSRTMLLPLLREFPNNTKFSFFHTPELRGLLRRIVPEKFNETIGVSHLKVYLTDDSFIISGANLSNDYFTNRQDRYIYVKNSPSVADFLDDLVKTVSDFSLELQKDGTTFLNHTSNPHPYRNWDGGRLFKQTANLKVKDFMDKWTKRSRTGVEQNQGDTLIFPLLQMGPLGITQDEQVTSRIFQNAPKGSRSFLATGYFNLTSRYLEDILKAQGYYEVLCAHPLANGFYKAGGIIGGIPDAFTQFAKEFYQKVNESGQTERITLQEYLRSQWTFHAKGLWYTPPFEHLPNLTLIGSPNFGHRSLKRDLENQTVLITNNVRLREQLRQEYDHVYKYAVKVAGETFESYERRVPLWARIVSGLTRSFF